jgi:hypothetical protein
MPDAYFINEAAGMKGRGLRANQGLDACEQIKVEDPIMVLTLPTHGDVDAFFTDENNGDTTIISHEISQLESAKRPKFCRLHHEEDIRSQLKQDISRVECNFSEINEMRRKAMLI